MTMKLIAKLSPRQGAQYLLGYALWTLGVGSILHPVLLEMREGHGCSYGLIGWPTAMITTMAFSVVGFPVVLLLGHIAVRWADKGPLSALAIRIGLASLPLVGIGIVSAVLVSVEVLDHHDPMFLSPILVFPLYLGVLAWSWPVTNDSLQAHRRIALVIFAIWAASSLGLGLFLYWDMFGGSGSWLVEGRVGWYLRGWGMMYLLGASLYILGLTSRSWRPLSTSFGWGFGATVLTVVPIGIVVLGFLVVHELSCAD